VEDDQVISNNSNGLSVGRQGLTKFLGIMDFMVECTQLNVTKAEFNKCFVTLPLQSAFTLAKYVSSKKNA
jgi:hypothetical protein